MILSRFLIQTALFSVALARTDQTRGLRGLLSYRVDNHRVPTELPSESPSDAPSRIPSDFPTISAYPSQNDRSGSSGKGYGSSGKGYDSGSSSGSNSEDVIGSSEPNSVAKELYLSYPRNLPSHETFRNDVIAAIAEWAKPIELQERAITWSSAIQDCSELPVSVVEGHWCFKLKISVVSWRQDSHEEVRDKIDEAKWRPDMQDSFKEITKGSSDAVVLPIAQGVLNAAFPKQGTEVTFDILKAGFEELLEETKLLYHLEMSSEFDYNADIESTWRYAEPFGQKTNCKAFVSRQYPDAPEAVWHDKWENIENEYDCYAIGVAIGSTEDAAVLKNVAQSIESQAYNAIESYIHKKIDEEIPPSLEIGGGPSIYFSY